VSNKKNLLNEAQIRQFMKLAKLGPLTPGFVHGLTERTAEEDLEESHGRGRGEGPAGYGQPVDAGRAGARLRELEDPEVELGDDEAVVELPVDDAAAEEVVDDVEAVEPGVEDAPTEDEVLAALQVIARAAGVEGLEMDVESTGEPSVEEPGLDEPGLEEPLGAEPGLEEPGLPGEEVPGEELEEGWERPKSAGGSAPSSKAGNTGRSDIANKASGRWLKEADDEEELEESADEDSTDDLVEQITKRVAARILKAALVKK